MDAELETGSQEHVEQQWAEHTVSRKTGTHLYIKQSTPAHLSKATPFPGLTLN